MLTSVQGVYRKGKIELEQKPENVSDETRVIVTFLDSGAVDLRKRVLVSHRQRRCVPS